MSFLSRHLADEAATARLGAEIALWLRRGDFVGLAGELGAGKTALARAILRALAGDPALDVPSPTFTLVQGYDAGRLEIGHFDLYRLEDAGDADELGLDEALEAGAALVEWPERLGAALPRDRLEIALAPAGDGGRTARIAGHGAWAARLGRLERIASFLDGAGWGGAARAWLRGDASTRSYERLTRPEPAPARAVLMNWPEADEPVVRDGRTYRQIAHLAANVTPFLAVGAWLRRLGLSAPEVYAGDEAAGLLLLEDLGDTSFGDLARAGADMDGPYEAAVGALARIHAEPAPQTLPLPGGRAHPVPAYDLDICLIEVELLTSWAWPALRRAPCPAPALADFRRIWTDLFASLGGAATLMLRDFHSPNLLWLPGREGAARAGIIDHQDAVLAHPAYDLVSLAQDARIDVDEAREAAIVEAYLGMMPARLGLDAGAFRRDYAILGAQRAVRLVGLFTRLPHRDGKPEYLAHMPRVTEYLARNLRHQALAPLGAWLEDHFGSDFAMQFRTIGPTP